MFLQQLESLSSNKGSVNRLIPNFNQDLVPFALGWLSFSVGVFLFKGCPGRAPVPLTLAFWTHTGSETTGRTHSSLGSSWGSCHLATTQSSHAIARATRQEGPPLKAVQPPRSPSPSEAPTHRSRAGSPALRRGAGNALAHAHAPHTPERTLGRSPQRAHAATLWRTQTAAGPGTAVSAAARERSGARSRSPPRALPAAPPRPAPQTLRAQRVWGCKVSPAVSRGSARARAGLRSAKLRTAVTAGRVVRPAARPALPCAPRRSRYPAHPSCRGCLRALRPQGLFSASCAPSLAFPPPPPQLRPTHLCHSSWPLAPLGPGRNQVPYCCCCRCFCCSGTRAAATQPPLGPPRPWPPTA